MDTLSHALYGKGLFGYKKYRWYSFFFGIIPDIFSFGIYFIYLILMSVSEKMLLLEYIPDFFGLWWLHACVAMIVYYIYIRDNEVIPNRS